MVSSFPHFFFARELCVRFDRIAESVHSGRTGNFSPLADLSPPSTTLPAPPKREGRVRLFKVREGSGLFSKSPFADATNVCVYALPSIPHLRGTAIIF